MTPDEEALRSLHADWIRAVNEGDVGHLVAAMTGDAVFLDPGREAFGPEVFAEGFRAAHQALRVRCRSEIEELVVCGDVAWTRCRDRLSVAPREGGPASELAGQRLTIYRRQADGRWRLARDAHTLSPVSQD